MAEWKIEQSSDLKPNVLATTPHCVEVSDAKQEPVDPQMDLRPTDPGQLMQKDKMWAFTMG